MSKSHKILDEYHKEQQNIPAEEYFALLSRVSESSRRVDGIMRLEEEIDVELNGQQEFEAQRIYCDFVHRLQVYSSPELERLTKTLSIELIWYIQDRTRNITDFQ